MTRTAPVVFAIALALPSSVMSQFSLVVIDPSDGSPELVNGGLAGVYSDDGMETPILIQEGDIADVYIGSGGVRLSSQSFSRDGMYHVRLFSHYHSKEFCKVASGRLKEEFVSKCASVGYRMCDLTVNTRARKFYLGKPWPCLYLDVTGGPLLGIGKAYLPQEWVNFDSLKTKDTSFLDVINEITKLVRDYGHRN